MEKPALSALDWRTLWDEGLDVDTRRRITRAVRRGQTLPTADEAAVATELATRWMRRVRTLIVFNVVCGLTLGLLLIALAHPGRNRPWSYWFMLALSGVWLLSPLVGWLQQGRLARVCAANLAVSRGQTG